MLDLNRIEGFEWDDANIRKSAAKHGATWVEAEEAFFNAPLATVYDAKHSGVETRFHALGATAAGRLLHATFTLRRNGALIRVISARDMNRKERLLYEAQA